ncbi:Vpu [Human immunodeficiency virus 1]|uniref:Protein Vpu n=1 Tax=Human immunodeficiency virus type 1 TaxID=11676 RepID=Q9Q706_HV1|nr:Vpu [Human immunodeficiency virus 1]
MYIIGIGIGALIVAFIIAIVVWTIVYIEYRKLVKQKKIDRLIQRIIEGAEDSGNESDEELSTMVERGHLTFGYVADL